MKWLKFVILQNSFPTEIEIGEGWKVRVEKRQKLGETVEWRIGVGRRPVGPSLLQTAVT